MKKIMSVLCAIALFASICIPVFAEAPADSHADEMAELSLSSSNYLFGNSKMSWKLCDENGNVVKTGNSMLDMTYGAVSIPNGYTMHFYNAQNTNFSFNANTTITFTVNWAKSALFIMGYNRSSTASSTTVYSNSVSEKSHTQTFSLPATDGYCFWVTNMSADTIKLTSASINTL